MKRANKKSVKEKKLLPFPSDLQNVGIAQSM
jgi:hypothetical protein